MPVQTICTVADIVRLNEFAYSLTLEVGKDMAPLISCGQFVHIKCGHSRLLRRPISICDWQTDEPSDLLKVVFEVRGDGTGWLSRRAPGDRLDVLGPLGHGFDVSGRKLLVAGGGIGVPPLLSCAKAGAEVHAALGFRDMAHQMLTTEFSEACKSMSVISDDGTTGRQGFVTELVEELLDREGGFDSVLACGPKPMLRGVAEAAAKRGVACQVSMEERMGCGVGACLVCACQTTDGHMKHVCKDGPVFLSTEVDWDA